MWKLYGNKEPLGGQTAKSRRIYVVLVTVGLILVVAASQALFSSSREYSESRSEYDELRELYPVMSMYLPSASYPPLPGDPIAPEQRAAAPGSAGTEPLIQDSPGAKRPDPLADLLELNPDFIGWIAIEGVIDYPVVRGADNDLYLDTTFSRNHNPSGTVFMDSRLTQGFYAPVCILYGHNMRDGTMFAPLHQYYSKAYMAEHPYIAVVTLRGEVLFYQVFAARYTNVLNKAYELGYTDGAAAAEAFTGAPDGATRFLLLSTCTNSEDKNERLLIYASLVN